MSASPTVSERLGELLLRFKMTTAAADLVPRLTEAGHDDALPHLLEVLELEAQERQERRIARLKKASKLPPGKTFDTLDTTRLPRALVQRLRELARGDFLEQAVNVLAFGLPGAGKTHSACALGHALVEAGHSVYFTPTFKLIQELLAAKRDLSLPRILRKLDQFELLILDEIGYVQQSEAETEVLFTLLAERYERRSLLITSNLVFSEWEQIFKNPMTTVSAIDRLVHHCEILEFDVPSYRKEAAAKKAKHSRNGSSTSNES